MIQHHPAYKNIKLKNYDEWAEKCPNLFTHTEKSDEEDIGSSDEESTENSATKTTNDEVQGEAVDNDFNASTCLYPKEPASDMIVNHSNEKKNVKFRRKDKKVYEYAPGDDTCGVS